MIPIHIAVIDSPIGKLQITTQASKLLGVTTASSEMPLIPASDAYGEIVTNQLFAYFTGQRQTFDLDLHRVESPFKTRVLNHLLQIPYGQTRTYGQLAQTLNTAARAIGQACRYNDFLIIIPCHRIVAANHDGGYAGETDGIKMDIKRWLLNHERQHQPSATHGPLSIAIAREKMLYL